MWDTPVGATLAVARYVHSFSKVDDVLPGGCIFIEKKRKNLLTKLDFSVIMYEHDHLWSVTMFCCGQI